jgi:hypothetical protein
VIDQEVVRFLLIDKQLVPFGWTGAVAATAAIRIEQHLQKLPLRFVVQIPDRTGLSAGNRVPDDANEYPQNDDPVHGEENREQLAPLSLRLQVAVSYRGEGRNLFVRCCVASREKPDKGSVDASDAR